LARFFCGIVFASIVFARTNTKGNTLAPYHFSAFERLQSPKNTRFYYIKLHWKHKEANPNEPGKPLFLLAQKLKKVEPQTPISYQFVVNVAGQLAAA